MNTPLESSTFLYMWLGFLLLMLCCIAGFFLWAVRSNQFSRQDRARYLALTAGIPPTDGEPQDGRWHRETGS